MLILMNRTATEERNTAETKIKIVFSLDSSEKSEIDTGIPFMDHMLTLFAKHGFFYLNVKAKGDLEVDEHHTMEDLGIVLGKVIRKALGNKAGIRRYGFFTLPMDEALVSIAIDISGRPYFVYNVPSPVSQVGKMDIRLFQEFFQSLSINLACNLHIDLKRGEEAHHIIESIFKCFGKTLDQATSLDPREKGIPSTKGRLND